jgi:hypothetical protein
MTVVPLTVVPLTVVCAEGGAGRQLLARGARRRHVWMQAIRARGESSRRLPCHGSQQAEAAAVCAVPEAVPPVGERARDAAGLQREVPQGPGSRARPRASPQQARSLSGGRVDAAAQVPSGSARSGRDNGACGAGCGEVSHATLGRQPSEVAEESVGKLGQGCGSVTRHPRAEIGQNHRGNRGISCRNVDSGGPLSRATFGLEWCGIMRELGQNLDRNVTSHPA